jgi:hypothetical protein
MANRAVNVGGFRIVDDSSEKRGQARMPVPWLETQCAQVIVTDFDVVKG